MNVLYKDECGAAWTEIDFTNPLFAVQNIRHS